MAPRRRGHGRRPPRGRDKDELYLMQRGLAAAGSALPTRKTWRIDAAALDQGTTGTCVGHAWRNFLRCAPLELKKSGPSAYDIYRKAVTLDDWRSNDRHATMDDGDARMVGGTTVRAGAKALKALGHLESYLWSFTLHTSLEWVLTRGPVVLGTDWWSSFERPDAEGIVRIKPNAKVTEGHAFLWRGVNLSRGLAVCTNSWGEDWGTSGDFLLPLADLERLIANDGEVCTAVQKHVAPKDVTPKRNGHATKKRVGRVVR